MRFLFPGKSSLLSVLGNREVPIQPHIDIYLLSREMPASEKTALEAVMEADAERVKLEALAEELVTMEDDDSQEYLMEVGKLCGNFERKVAVMLFLV